MTQRFGKSPKYFRNGLDTLGHGLSVSETAFIMLEMAYEFDKRLKYVGNDVYLWERD